MKNCVYNCSTWRKQGMQSSQICKAVWFVCIHTLVIRRDFFYGTLDAFYSFIAGLEGSDLLWQFPPIIPGRSLPRILTYLSTVVLLFRNFHFLLFFKCKCFFLSAIEPARFSTVAFFFQGLRNASKDMGVSRCAVYVNCRRHSGLYVFQKFFLWRKPETWRQEGRAERLRLIRLVSLFLHILVKS